MAGADSRHKIRYDLFLALFFALFLRRPGNQDQRYVDQDYGIKHHFSYLQHPTAAYATFNYPPSQLTVHAKFMQAVQALRLRSIDSPLHPLSRCYRPTVASPREPWLPTDPQEVRSCPHLAPPRVKPASRVAHRLRRDYRTLYTCKVRETHASVVERMFQMYAEPTRNS